MEKKKPYAFVSYCSQNGAEAEAVRNLLTENEVNIWMAPYDIPAGAKYAHVIDETIEKCACFLLLLTKESQESAHVEREVERAVSYKKEIIPIRLDQCELNPGFRYYISGCQIVDVDVFEESDVERQFIIDRIDQLVNREEYGFYKFLDSFSEWLALEKRYEINRERLKLLESIYEFLIVLLKEAGYDDDEYNLVMEPDPLGLGDAVVSLECYDIVIRNVRAFCEIAQYFENIEIHSVGEERVQISGVFGGVARIVKYV